MSSSRHKHHESSSSGPLKNSGRDENPSRNIYQNSPLAGSSSGISRPQRPLVSETITDRGRARAKQSVLPSANFRDNSTAPSQPPMLNGVNTVNLRDNSAAGPSSQVPTYPSAPKQHPRSIPVPDHPIYGGRSDPHYRPDKAGEPDYTIYPRPRAGFYNQFKPFMDRICRYPVSMTGNPRYRANYSTIGSQQDLAMAQRQLRIDTLDPAERAIQKRWAKQQLRIGEFCPQGYSWWSFKTEDRATDGKQLDGYRCWAGGHTVTHELLVEDKGKFYSRFPDGSGTDVWCGPIFPQVNPVSGGPKERGEPQWKKDPNYVWGLAR